MRALRSTLALLLLAAGTLSGCGNDNGVSGIFALRATGFLAEQPNRENQQVFVQGSFSAKASN